MSYIVKLKGDRVVRLTDEDAWILKNCLAEARGTVMVEIGDDMVRSTEIMAINKEHLTEADVAPIRDKARLVEAGKRCRGQFSIQHEINMAAFRNSRIINEVNPEGVGWGKLIKDLDWREMMRQKFRNGQPRPWCDHYVKECSCGPDYRSEAPRHLPEGISLL